MSRSIWVSRVGITLLTTIAVGGAVTPALAAATTGAASVSGSSQVNYKAGNNRTNTVTITRTGRTVTIDDKVTVKAGKGCKKVKGDKTKVRCTTTETTKLIVVTLGDRDDTAYHRTSTASKIYGGGGNDRITGGGGNDRLVGDSGADKIWGGAGHDSIDGGSATDTLDGGTGNDKLYGATGSDNLTGGTGNDRVQAGAGNDRIIGGPGNDTESGDSGDDTLTQPTVTGSDADTLTGGPGRDLLSYASRMVGVHLSLNGAKGDDGWRKDNGTREGDTIADTFETLAGTIGGDTIRGSSGNDTLYGCGPLDKVNGEAGDDVILGVGGPCVRYPDHENPNEEVWPGSRFVGGAGNDTIRGTTGNDYVVGDYDTVSTTKRPVGTDTLDGGGGHDSVSYEFAGGPVTIGNDTVAGNEGQAGEGDTLLGFLNFRGSEYNDVIHSRSGDRAYNTSLVGLGGDDELLGGEYTYLDGGDGADHLISGEWVYGSDPGDDGDVDRLDGGQHCNVYPNDTAVNCDNVIEQ